MPAPITVAAIDAGSNAIRLVIADSQSPIEYRRLASERYPVRLGHGVFTDHAFDETTLAHAEAAFEHFRLLMDHYGVQAYRAVATSATREALNRDQLLERVEASAGIKLEVIDGEEEARLVRIAVLSALSGIGHADFIVDLGGGSLEVSRMDGNQVVAGQTLSIGTVRLMESFHLDGALGFEENKKLRRVIAAEMEAIPRGSKPRTRPLAIACGGNAERLARVAGGRRFHGIRTIDVAELRRELPRILSLGSLERMAAFGVRRDRAEVMGVAAVVFDLLSKRLGLGHWVVPGVGVREGLLHEILADHFVHGAQEGRDQERRAAVVGARRFGRRLRWDASHADHVTQLALSLFDQLESLTGQGEEERYLLELGSLLHQIGSIVQARDAHVHSEYLVMHGDLPGMLPSTREKVACLVRLQAEPDYEHPFLATLTPEERSELRQLAGMLRIASTLDRDHRQAAGHLEAVREEGALKIKVHWAKPSPLPVPKAEKRGALLGEALGETVRFEWLEGAVS